jgi:hypothetical protein
MAELQRGREPALMRNMAAAMDGREQAADVSLMTGM